MTRVRLLGRSPPIAAAAGVGRGFLVGEVGHAAVSAVRPALAIILLGAGLAPAHLFDLLGLAPAGGGLSAPLAGVAICPGPDTLVAVGTTLKVVGVVTTRVLIEVGLDGRAAVVHLP